MCCYVLVIKNRESVLFFLIRSCASYFFAVFFSRQKGDAMSAISFYALGHNLVVHCPGSYIHVYEVQHLNSDTAQMNAGLYHLSLDGAVT